MSAFLNKSHHYYVWSWCPYLGHHEEIQQMLRIYIILVSKTTNHSCLQLYSFLECMTINLQPIKFPFKWVGLWLLFTLPPPSPRWAGTKSVYTRNTRTAQCCQWLLHSYYTLTLVNSSVMTRRVAVWETYILLSTPFTASTCKNLKTNHKQL